MILHLVYLEHMSNLPQPIFSPRRGRGGGRGGPRGSNTPRGRGSYVHAAQPAQIQTYGSAPIVRHTPAGAKKNLTTGYWEGGWDQSWTLPPSDIMPAPSKRTRVFDEEVDGLAFSSAPKKLCEDIPKVDLTPAEALALEVAEKEKKAKREKLLALANQMKLQHDWSVLMESSGTIRLVQAGGESADCFVPSSEWWKQAFENEESRLVLAEAHLDKKDWAWVAVYKNTTPGKEAVTHLTKAIRMLESHNVGIATSQFQVHSLKKANKVQMPVLLVTTSEDQIKAFLQISHFAFERDKKEMTFFTQGSLSFGSHIVVNLTNCLDVEAEVAQGAYTMFTHIITFLTRTDKEWKPRQFHIARIKTNNLGIVWHIRFKANREQLIQSGIPVESNFNLQRGQEDDPEEEEDTSDEAVDGDEEMEAEPISTSAPTPGHSQQAPTPAQAPETPNLSSSSAGLKRKTREETEAARTPATLSPSPSNLALRYDAENLTTPKASKC
ncbi:hypothetical protein FRB94_002693 [Tulasnella sp. JGI-2019a]|nr:hypothetical protein FRB94_002693 [Tulasnella sp. JGI-2019a]